MEYVYADHSCKYHAQLKSINDYENGEIVATNKISKQAALRSTIITIIILIIIIGLGVGAYVFVTRSNDALAKNKPPMATANNTNSTNSTSIPKNNTTSLSADPQTHFVLEAGFQTFPSKYDIRFIPEARQCDFSIKEEGMCAGGNFAIIVAETLANTKCIVS